MWEIVQGLRLMLTRKEKFRLAGVVILLSGGALMEIAGLGLLLPLVAAFGVACPRSYLSTGRVANLVLLVLEIFLPLMLFVLSRIKRGKSG